MRSSFFCLILLVSQWALSQSAFDNSTFDDRLATIILQKDISIYDPLPIISLGSDEKLRLSFDHLSPQNEFYNYTFIHCNSKWEPSSLQQMEYLNGNPMGEITEFKYSTNTHQVYTHYSLTFPSNEMEITKSGNYILKVFRNFDEEDLVLTRRFMVADQNTKISATVRSGTNAEYRFTHQEVDFEVDYQGYTIPNPFLDVNVNILQNNSWNNSIIGLKPLFVNGNKLSFNYEDKNLFPGTNEFRFFDIRSLRFFSNQVIKKYMDSLQNVVLQPDEIRAHLNYVRWVDYNGKRVITNRDGVNIVEDGDYAMVHFYLKSNNEIEAGDVYIYGELSDWKLDDRFKMTYWPEYDMYSCSVKLKQSYYNYHYVIKDKTGNIDYTFTEGNHQDTENDYTILVYHKNVFLGYDELIGVHTKNTNSVSDE